MDFNPLLKRDCKGRPALCRGSGWPRKTPFLSFCAPPAAAREKGKEPGDTPGPRSGAGRPRQPRFSSGLKERTFDRKLCFESCTNCPCSFRGKYIGVVRLTAVHHFNLYMRILRFYTLGGFLCLVCRYVFAIVERYNLITIDVHAL